MLYTFIIAVVAQLVEQLIRNEQVAGSTPVNGSIEVFICKQEVQALGFFFASRRFYHDIMLAFSLCIDFEFLCPDPLKILAAFASHTNPHTLHLTFTGLCLETYFPIISKLGFILDASWTNISCVFLVFSWAAFAPHFLQPSPDSILAGVPYHINPHFLHFTFTFLFELWYFSSISIFGCIFLILSTKISLFIALDFS